MIYTGFLFAANDVVLCSQYLYFGLLRPRLAASRSSGERRALLHQQASPSSPPAPMFAHVKGDQQGSKWWCTFFKACGAVCLGALVAYACLSPSSTTAPLEHAPAAKVAPEEAELCDAAPVVSDGVHWAGVGMSWFSNSAYVVARFPQILTNRRRRSVEGLSMAMFVMGLSQ